MQSHEKHGIQLQNRQQKVRVNHNHHLNINVKDYSKGIQKHRKLYLG